MLSKENLHKLFEYKDGNLYWKDNYFKSFIGKKAGFSSGNNYIRINIKNKQYFAHRIIFMMHHGYLPNIIDHIDRNSLNNKIENLREADARENALNSTLTQPSITGIRNVYFDKRRNKYNVVLKVNKKHKFIGSYFDLELAELVSTMAKEKYYGKFANI